MGLSDLVSRSGERHSPKRGREETWTVLSEPRSRSGEMVSPKRDVAIKLDVLLAL